MDAKVESAGERVIDFALSLPFAEIPPATIEMAGLLLLDTLGVAAAAGRLEAGRIARDAAARMMAPGAGAPAARLPFDGRRASLAGAAYATATQIDNLDAHDGYNPSKGHIGVGVVPALVAFAEARPALSGREALATLVMSYELAARAALALHGTVSDYHTSGAWNALAVAAVGARLRGLSKAQLREALGIAEYHGPRSQMMREIDNPSMLHDGSGWGALAGATAAVLAEAGFTGAPAITVEAPEVAAYWADLGSRWLTDLQYIKPYPICRWAHAAIDCALALRRAHGLAGDEIVGVDIVTFANAARLAGGMPASSPVAQYSLAFPVAAALARGRVGVAEVTGAALADPAIGRLVAATSIAESEDYTARFPAGRWSEVSLLLKDGRRLESGPKNARGGPEEPLTKDEVLEKFRAYAGPALGEARAAAIEGAILALAAPEADFKALVELLAAPAN